MKVEVRMVEVSVPISEIDSDQLYYDGRAAWKVG